MSEENKTIFRKKSTDYINSPEKMDQYLHVTSPGVWFLLLAVIILLIGVCAWGVLGRIEAHVPVAIITENGQSTCLVPKNALDAVIKNQAAELEGKEITLVPDSLEAIVVSEDTNVYILLAGDLKIGDVVYKIPVSEKLDDGIHKGSVATESISPMSLLFN